MLNSAFVESYEELCATHTGSSKTALEEQFEVNNYDDDDDDDDDFT